MLPTRVLCAKAGLTLCGIATNGVVLALAEPASATHATIGTGATAAARMRAIFFTVTPRRSDLSDHRKLRRIDKTGQCGVIHLFIGPDDGLIGALPSS
jgi:hypothetical protein